MRKLIYNLKVLIAAINIYCHYGDTSAKGAAEQARVVVDAVDNVCKKKERMKYGRNQKNTK
jgi:hypothetical protein